MDRETKRKFLEAQKKAEDELARQAKAKDPSNKEFWEAKLKQMIAVREATIGNLADAELAIEGYKQKIETFD